MEKALYGCRLRADLIKRRDRASFKKVDQRLKELRRQHLPCLEVVPVDEERYESELDALLSVMAKTFESQRDLRLAHLVLARTISEGNKVGDWCLPIPSRLLKVPRSAQPRTKSFFESGAQVADFYQHWRQKLAQAELQEPEYRLANVVVSAAIHGGLANKHALLALVKQLSSLPKPLLNVQGRYWLDLVWQGGQGCHNVVLSVDGKDQGATLRRFYPDSFTLCLIHHYLKKRTPEDLSSEGLGEYQLWSQLKALFGVVAGTGLSLSSWHQFCRGAPSVTEMLEGVELPQALVGYTTGSVKTSSLTQVQQHSLWRKGDPVVHPLHFNDFRSPVVNPSKKSVRRQSASNTLEDFIHQSRKVLATPKGKKKTPKIAVEALQQLRSDSLPIAASTLLEWFISRLGELQVSSVKRYHSALCIPWLLETVDFNFDDATERDFEELYSEILDRKRSNKERSFLAGRLEDFHGFAVRYFGFPALYGFFSADSSSSNKRVRPGVVIEPYFKSLIASVEHMSGLDDHSREGLVVLLILAYRLGLRRGELLKLRLKDIEPSPQRWLFVRNNSYGNNKSSSALRKLPLSTLLLGEELGRFNQYLAVRQARTKSSSQAALMFSLDSKSTIPWQGDVISRIVRHCFMQQGVEGMTFHHLRHSALSILSVVIDANSELIEQLTAYSPEQAKHIRTVLVSMNPDYVRDSYWALAGIAGHLTPEVTFANYLHFSDLQLACRVKAFDPLLSMSEVVRSTGLTAAKLRCACSCSEGAVKDQKIRLSQLAPIVEEAVSGWSESLPEEKVENHGKASEVKPTSKPKAYGIELCDIALRELEQGLLPVEVALKLGLNESQIERWLYRARALQTLKTQKGKSRLLDDRRKSTGFGLPLLPSKPASNTELIDVNRIVGIVRELFDKERGDPVVQGEIVWAIRYFLAKVTTSSAGLRFRSPDDLQRFTAAVALAIPLKRWRLELYVPNAGESPVASDEWCVCPNVQWHEGKPKGRVFGFLHLRHPAEDKLLGKYAEHGYQKFSSNALRYVFHMLAIMIGVVAV
jgi:integrase